MFYMLSPSMARKLSALAKYCCGYPVSIGGDNESIKVTENRYGYRIRCYRPGVTTQVGCRAGVISTFQGKPSKPDLYRMIRQAIDH